MSCEILSDTLTDRLRSLYERLLLLRYNDYEVNREIQKSNDNWSKGVHAIADDFDFAELVCFESLDIHVMYMNPLLERKAELERLLGYINR